MAGTALLVRDRTEAASTASSNVSCSVVYPISPCFAGVLPSHVLWWNDARHTVSMSESVRDGRLSFSDASIECWEAASSGCDMAPLVICLAWRAFIWRVNRHRSATSHQEAL